jgi:hypothetical protein
VTIHDKTKEKKKMQTLCQKKFMYQGMDEIQVTTIGLSHPLVIIRGTLTGDREKSLGQTHLFNL